MSEIEQLKIRINELENKLGDYELKKTKSKPSKNEEPVECEICHKMLKNKYILKTHMRNKHDNNRERFECPYCLKKIASKYYLTTHIEHIHSDEIELENKAKANDEQ